MRRALRELKAAAVGLAVCAPMWVLFLGALKLGTAAVIAFLAALGAGLFALVFASRWGDESEYPDLPRDWRRARAIFRTTAFGFGVVGLTVLVLFGSLSGAFDGSDGRTGAWIAVVSLAGLLVALIGAGVSAYRRSRVTPERPARRAAERQDNSK